MDAQGGRNFGRAYQWFREAGLWIYYTKYLTKLELNNLNWEVLNWDLYWWISVSTFIIFKNISPYLWSYEDDVLAYYPYKAVTISFIDILNNRGYLGLSLKKSNTIFTNMNPFQFHILWTKYYQWKFHYWVHYQWFSEKDPRFWLLVKKNLYWIGTHALLFTYSPKKTQILKLLLIPICLCCLRRATRLFSCPGGCCSNTVF